MTATDAPATAASWPPGLPRSLEYPDVPVGSILRAAAHRWGERPAFIDHDVPLTYEEMGRRAHAVAGWLADHGVGRGDVVAVHIPNCRQYPPLYYGILLSGATFSPVAGASCRWYIASTSSPLVICAPTTEPAEVPTTRSAPLRSVPAAASPASRPISQAMPVIPPPPSTRAVR